MVIGDGVVGQFRCIKLTHYPVMVVDITKPGRHRSLFCNSVARFAGSFHFLPIPGLTPGATIFRRSAAR